VLKKFISIPKFVSYVTEALNELLSHLRNLLANYRPFNFCSITTLISYSQSVGLLISNNTNLLKTYFISCNKCLRKEVFLSFRNVLI